MSNVSRTRAWVEIDLAALRANFQVVRERAAAARGVLPMVKANAYGLGVEPIVRALEPLEPWGYGVATAAEGAALRALGVLRPILVATPLVPGEESLVVEASLTAAVSDLDALCRLRDAAAARPASAGPIRYHVEIDTGMGRAGLPADEVERWGRALAEAAGSLVLEGAFTHFHSADEPYASARPRTEEQAHRFEQAVSKLPVERASLLLHATNSAAALRWPEYAYDLVRPGIFLYGGRIAPADDADAPVPAPVAALRAAVMLVRDVPAGATCGYGVTYCAKHGERWASVAIGYGDGLPRALGNCGEALVRGRRVRVCGRVSMDSVVLDVSDVPGVAPGDAVTFLGADGAARIELEEVAAHAGTIGYEILTGIGTRPERVYIGTDA